MVPSSWATLTKKLTTTNDSISTADRGVLDSGVSVSLSKCMVYSVLREELLFLHKNGFSAFFLRLDELLFQSATSRICISRGRSVGWLQVPPKAFLQKCTMAD